MIELKHAARFWRFLLASGGSMTRWDLGKKVFFGNWSKTEMNQLLAVPLLSGLIAVVKERTRHARGPIPERIVLTPFGWEHAKLWRLSMPAINLPLEELRRQFDRLVAAGCPWATELVKDAEFGRQQRAELARLKEERLARLEEKRKRQEAKIKPPAKHPSAGRHRSEKEEAARAAWRAKHWRQSAQEQPSTQPAPPTAPSAPSWRPSRPEPPRAAPVAPVAPESPWWISAGISQPRPAPAPLPAPSPAGNKSTALLDKIARAGYQTKNGRVLYGGDRWITPEEWMRLCPGVVSA